MNRRPANRWMRTAGRALAACCTLAAAGRVLAQAPQIDALLPAGGPRGDSTTVRIYGKNLAGARLFLSGAGVTLKSLVVAAAGDSATAELEVRPDAALGPREVRIATPNGPSNGRRFWVDTLRNLALESPMSESDPPRSLDGLTPVVINGRITAAAGRDRFSFSAQAGETWVFDASSARIRSRLDPVLELRDESGQQLRLAQSTWERDPDFAHTFAHAGKYTLTIRDSEYKGGPDYSYRLTLGKLPLITGFIPRGERPGHAVGLILQGVNLGGSRSSVATIPRNTPSGLFWVAANTRGGAALPIPLIVDSAPVAGITETDANMPLPVLPANLDGAFERFPRIRFFFKGKPGERLVFDLLGRRIGSRIDGALRITDASGKEVASNDDAVDKDARLEFAPPAEGIYTVEARNVEEKTGPDCYYRLVCRMQSPDFRVLLELDRLSVPAGGSAAFPVTVEREGGFQGPVSLEMEGLPAGVRFSGGIIPAGKTSAEVTLTALAGSAFAASPVTLRGRASIAGPPGAQAQSRVHSAVPREKYEHRSVDQLLSVEYSYPRPFHRWELFLAAITERKEPFGLALSLDSVTLKPGGKAEFLVRAARRIGTDGEIKLAIRGLPDKVTAAVTPIGAKQNEARIVLTAAPDAPAGLSNAIVQGTLGGDNQPAPAIRVSVER